MKYVITGASGNTGRPIAEALLKKGHVVTVVSRNADHVKDLEEKGAEVAVGDVEDRLFLKKIFEDADAVYTMVPPNWTPSNWKNWIGSIGDNFAAAIRGSKVKKVVNLSSQGADKPDGVGPVSGLYKVEQALNKLEAVDIVHLRPGYFFQNLLANVAMVKNAQIMGSNFSGNIYLSDPADIADAAIDALLNPVPAGSSVRYLVSDKRDTTEIATALGKSVGQPELPWIKFSDNDAHDGMLQAGLTEETVKNYVEMGAALDKGVMSEDLEQHLPKEWGKTKLEDFVPVFAHVYNQ